MWNFIKKASEFIAPIVTSSPLEDFKDSCDTALLILKENKSDSFTFSNSLQAIQNILTDEVNQNDMPCFNLFVSGLYLQQFSELVNFNTPEDQIESLLNFFLSFANTNLNSYFAQISVHRPFTTLMSKLESLYLKNSEKTKDFVKNLWIVANKSSLMLELMAIHKDKNITYPFFDFLIDASLTISEIGNLSRSIIINFFTFQSNNNDPNIKIYISNLLFPKLIEFLCELCSSFATVQFDGSISSLINWIDQIFIDSDESITNSLFNNINNLSNSLKLIALSFILSFFSCKCLFQPAFNLSISNEIMNIIFKCLDSDEIENQKSSISLIKTLILIEDAIPFLLPPKSNENTDVLSILPAEWLGDLIGSTSLESYEYDAGARLSFFGKHYEGNNIELFQHILGLFLRFKNLSLQIILSLTQLITFFLSAQPSLINSQLSKCFESVVNEYKNIERFDLPLKDNSDNNFNRAAILTEFGKEIHSTFLASEKIVRVNEMFDE